LKTCYVFVLALLAATAIAAVPQTPPSNQSLTDNPVFQQNCAKCHGKKADGRMFAGPSLRSPKVTSSSEDQLRELITNGKHRMPKFAGKLSPEEIDTLVQQIKALSSK